MISLKKHPGWELKYPPYPPNGDSGEGPGVPGQQGPAVRGKQGPAIRGKQKAAI